MVRGAELVVECSTAEGDGGGGGAEDVDEAEDGAEGTGSKVEVDAED